MRHERIVLVSLAVSGVIFGMVQQSRSADSPAPTYLAGGFSYQADVNNKGNFHPFAGIWVQKGQNLYLCHKRLDASDDQKCDNANALLGMIK